MYRRLLHARIPTTALLALPVVVSIPAPSPDAAIVAPTLSNSKAHHPPPGGTGFNNPWPSFVNWDQSASGLFGVTAMYNTWRDWTSHPIPSPEALPSVRSPLDDNWGNGNLRPQDLKVTWLGHACFLVEFPAPKSGSVVAARGARVLFDPIFSNRCSPSQYVGPKRVTAPPFKIEQLPEIDAVVISHNHYDHLDVATIKSIYAAQTHGTVHFFVPLGNAKWFAAQGFDSGDCSEMDWWDERDLAVSLPTLEGSNAVATSIRLSCLPCQHFTGRSLTDRYHTLWASWAVAQAVSSTVPTKSSVWFGGDTGYKSVPRGCVDESGLATCPAFKEIGERVGPFDLSMIPIGAYDPRFAMSRVHCNPEDAVAVHQDVKSKRSIGGHWGTFVLTCEEMTEPPKRLKAAAKASGLAEDEFTVCDIGETTLVSVG